MLGGLILLSLAAYLLYEGPREPWRFVRRRRLRRRGRLANGQVVGIDPLGQGKHDPVGHPVTVLIVDGHDPGPTVHDPDGLRGYLVREGSWVTVRCLPSRASKASKASRASKASVGQVRGPRGSYRPYGDIPVARPTEFLRTEMALTSGVLGIVLLTAPVTVGHAISVAKACAGVGAAVMLVDRLRAFAQYRRTEVANGVITNRWERTTREIGVNEPGGPTTTYPCVVYFAASDGREVHAQVPQDEEETVTHTQQQVEVTYDRDRPVEILPRETRLAIQAGPGVTDRGLLHSAPRHGRHPHEVRIAHVVLLT